MMSFRGNRLSGLKIPQGTVWLLESLAECRGKQALYEAQSPQILKVLREVALVESTESSNRIEGVTVDRDRLRPLVLGRSKPRDRSEAEIVGYRRALSWIHTSHEKISIEPSTILRLHALAQGGTSGDAGQWKKKQNDIIEIHPDGRRKVRFQPLEPKLVPAAMEELCLSFRDVIQQEKVVALMSVAALILDFLCIHPFRDGNGRVSRLLTLLALYHQSYFVGRYVSLERLVEQTKESYYESLKNSSAGWPDGKHDLFPWFNYFLSNIRMAYREFEERATRVRPVQGSKTDLVVYALENVQCPFGIADIERL
ncbi:MAG: Fic family protein, partial [Deltaproteobacteria bacterium]